MPNNMFLSIIVTTIDRIKQIKGLIQSIEEQKFNHGTIQIIIIDQSRINLKEVIKCYKHEVVYIKTNKISLSKARNLGLTYSTGKIVCFPDDDCVYEKGIFNRLYKIIHSQGKGKISFWQFPIFSIDDKYTHVARKWNKDPSRIGLFLMLKNTASAGIFIKSRDIIHQFSEDLGVGAKYSSCEDLIFIWDNIINRDGIHGYYVGASEKYIYHPENNYIDISKQKNYNRGHIKSWEILFHQSNYYNKIILCFYIGMTFAYHLLSFLFGHIKGNKIKSKYHYSILSDRLSLLMKL